MAGRRWCESELRKESRPSTLFENMGGDGRNQGLKFHIQLVVFGFTSIRQLRCLESLHIVLANTHARFNHVHYIVTEFFALLDNIHVDSTNSISV